MKTETVMLGGISFTVPVDDAGHPDPYEITAYGRGFCTTVWADSDKSFEDVALFFEKLASETRKRQEQSVVCACRTGNAGNADPCCRG